MKRIVYLVAVGGVFCGLGGCAMFSSVGLGPERVEVVDHRKMQLIDNEARRSGVTVIWLRQPTKTVDRNVLGG